MEFYFQNSFFEIQPYLRKTLLILKEAVSFLFFITGFFLLFFSINKAKFLGVLILLIFTVEFLRRNSSKEDIRDLKTKKIEKINLDDYLTKKTKFFIINILTQAEILKIKNFEVYFLKEVLKKKEIKKLFYRLNVPFKDFLNEIEKLKDIETDHNPLPILESAFYLAKSLNQPSINILFIFYGLREKNKSLNEVFENFDLKKEYILSGIIMEIFSKKIILKKSKFQPIAVFHQKKNRRGILNKALTSRPTHFLDNYGIDLTLISNKENAGFLIGHQKELEKIIENLVQGDNVLLIGDEGTGKETIILHLAWRIQNDLVPKELLDYRLVKLDLGLLYSQDKENFLENLSKILQEVLYSGYIILYFPYFENILLQKDLNILQVLNEVLNKKAIPIIATMSNVGYEKSSVNYNLDQFFEKIEVEELTEQESVYLLTLKSLIWEKEHNITITPQSIALAVTLAKKFIKTKQLPASAEEILIECISLAKKNRGKILNREIVQEIISEKTKIPVGIAIEEEKEKLLNLENLLHQRIVNQEEAIKEIARVLKIYRAGLGKEKGTIGNFLFVGPTGVGKTETAKALAKIYYGSKDRIIRLDMVEFQNPEDIEKLIGSKDGSILGQLTEPVRQNPFSLILLDEFEKTHPSILKIFLPIFDEGIIKDALGREVDFRNTLIICTSNAYSEFIKESIEKRKDFDKIKEELKSKLSQIFSVELLNRFDGIIVYKPLGQEELLKIAQILIDDLKTEILLKYGVSLEVNEEALKEIVRLGTDPIFGARPLARKIEEIIKSEIANLILANKLSRGNKILVDFKKSFQFQIE